MNYSIKYLGDYGIPKVWYYPFTKTYWFGYDANKIRQYAKQNMEEDLNSNFVLFVKFRAIWSLFS